MSASRSPFYFTNPASPYDGLPLEVVNRISGIDYYFNHFLTWEGPVAEGLDGGWLLSGTTGAATIVHTAVKNGEIVLTADATGSCNPTLQLGNTTADMPFTYTVGKRLWVFAKQKYVTVATTEVFFGLGTADTSPCTTGTFPSDGIFWYKASTDTKMSFQARKDGTGTAKTTITGTLVDATYTTLGFTVDRLGAITPWQDGVALTSSAIAPGTANIPVAAADTLTFMLGILGASMTCTLDWLLIAQEL